jgi:epoxyqueuosine reductase
MGTSSPQGARKLRAPVPFEELRAIAAAHGIVHLGVAPATVMERARTALTERKQAGLHADMQFTYRNPERSTDPQQSLQGAQSVIVAARSYRLAEAAEGHRSAETHDADHLTADHLTADHLTARVARYAQIDHYSLLIAALREMSSLLKEAGHRAVVLCDDNAIVDREIAYRGGLGWFGKNANLLMPGAGSYFVLGCVITDAEYPTATPVADGCGSCVRCFEACPTGAIISAGVVDSNRCLAWLVQKAGDFPVQFRSALGDRMYGCDDCQDACPPTVRFSGRYRPDLPAHCEPQPTVVLREFFTLSDTELLERYGQWYVADRDPRWWRRNALIVIGNTATARASDRWVHEVLAAYAAGDDPILAEHAQWAMSRLIERGVAA